MIHIFQYDLSYVGNVFERIYKVALKCRKIPLKITSFKNLFYNLLKK